ncbi:MAG: PIG-L family deacetylase [bacterium]|nr:PIG-L family deacetylase [bacterium]
MTLSHSDRILILAPHPDDEVLGCAGIIQAAVKLRVPVRVVFLTYGDNNEWSFFVYRKHPVLLPKAVKQMGLIRHEEAIQADAMLGIPANQITFLGYPDFRTLRIWLSHWNKSPVAESMFTRVTAVPYPNAFRPGALYKGDEILKDITAILREYKPTKIFLSHPADFNPDHQALYLFTQIALWNLHDEIQPSLYPYLIHYKNWPKPRKYIPNQPLVMPYVLQQEIVWHQYHLQPDEIFHKLAALNKHKTQYESHRSLLISFVRNNEVFGDFPTLFLNPNSVPTMVSKGNSQPLDIPEQLTEIEQLDYIGVEQRLIHIDTQNNLVLTIKLSRSIGKTVSVSVYVFGYRHDRNFASMPKLHINFGLLRHQIFDQNTLLPLNIVKINRTPQEITMYIPLHILGDPQQILTSARTYLTEVPLDWAAWRIIKIK